MNVDAFSTRVRKTLLWGFPISLVIWFIFAFYTRNSINNYVAQQTGWEKQLDYLAEIDFSITQVGIDEMDRTWFGTMFDGVGVIAGEEVTFYNTKNSGIASDWVQSITLNTEGDLWAGTMEGLSFFDGQEWINYTTGNSEIVDNQVNSVAIDPEERVWLGTPNGISVFDGESWVSYTSSNSEILDDTVTCIAVDHGGRIWADINGISVYDGDKWINYSPKNNNLIRGVIISIVFDQGENTWIGGVGGTSVFDGKTWITYNTENSGLVSDNVNDIVIDLDNKVWFATDNGVSVWDGTAWTSFTEKNSALPENYIEYLGVYSTGEMLMNTWIFSNDGQKPAPQKLVSVNNIFTSFFVPFVIIVLWMIVGFLTLRTTNNTIGRYLKKIPLPKENFLLWWVFATVIAWCIFLPIYLSPAFFSIVGSSNFLAGVWGRETTLFQLLRLYIGVSFVIGVCQWFVLRQFVRQAGWWILATVGGTVIGMILRWFIPNTDWFLDLIFIFPFVGIFQWLFLLRVVSVNMVETLLWILVKGMSFVVGIFLSIIVLIANISINLYDWLESFSGPWYAATELSMAITFGIVFGLSTGIHLKKVLEKNENRL